MSFVDWFFGTEPQKSMTDNYVGKHGEFSRNDEERAICEDMYSMHVTHPDADLSDHYDWENEMNYEGDGYEDEDEDF